ncbi:DENND6 [Kalmanozyma brasiliensis GHG001]|uniref:DENND6 n=1 Tax=Kalmanozyma brasiliensis (strain GHG001) TaxID=1365824 RepID=UPI0028680429|nr:DENND6 [Kalmanozyma brasiliensis GHG001]EST10053.2 DENND6 [Kalmanozyma brasiliensis GHG001]
MAAFHTASSPNTGDGDLGLFAIESRPSSTSYDDTGIPRRPSQAELMEVPSYPGPVASAASVLNRPDSRTGSDGPTLTSNGTADVSSIHYNIGASAQTPVSTGLSKSIPAPPSKEQTTSSRLAAMSLQDESARNDVPASRGASSSISSSSAASSSASSNLVPSAALISSSSSNYTSAAESPASETASRKLPSPVTAPAQASLPSSTPPPVPPKSRPTPSVSQQSFASTTTITHAKWSSPRLATSGVTEKQAISVEQELEQQLAADLDPSPTASTTAIDAEAISRRSSRRSRRSGLPPLQDRLPVGGGGPSAPPRATSFRDASKRTSVGNGYGDLGAEALSVSGTSPSSPSLTSFLDLDSPRTSESSNTNRRPLPSRRTSLQAPSPRTPTFSADHSHSPLDGQASGSTTAARPASGRTSSHTKSPPTSRPASRGPSSGGKAALAGLYPTKAAATPKLAPPKQLNSLNLDRESMQRWVLSVGCVNFDLELGPDLEFLYPPLGISREERDNIAFSSFPDTSIFDDGSLVFSWRVREVPLNSSVSEPPTIKTLNDALQQPSTLGDDETPRPSLNKTALQNAMLKKGAPDAGQSLSSSTAPPVPPKSAFRDASAPSSGPSQSLSRPTSNVNLRNGGIDVTPASAPPTTSFHERLTQKLFSSSGSSAMSRHMSHDRHSSAHSTSSASADDDGDTTVPAASVDSSATSTGSTIPASTNQSVPTSDLINSKRAAGNSTSSSYIYGYVFFRQKPDATNRRGYFQKSVVILSHLPLVGLFSEVVARLGPLYFEHGMSMFEAFANDIMSWPAPHPGTILTLPLLGSIITAAIPFGQQPQNSPSAESAPMQATLSAPGSTSSGGFMNAATATIRSRSRQPSANGTLAPHISEPSPEGPLLASIPTTSLFHTFQQALSDLWLLWECVLLAEPILVIAPEPKIASEAVWHMLDLIRPIPYAGDFRPYFHIHDYDFRTLVTKNKPQAGTLIASTNPFFATACGHWPHVLRVGKAAVKLIQIKHGAGGSGSGFAGAPSGKKPNSGIGGGQGAGGGGPDHIPGFTTKRKRRISKDRALLKRLQDLAKSGSEADILAANVAMRRYFADLTERFLAPLNRYVASLVPASFDLSSPSEVPRIRPFNTTDFLASLKAHGTPLAIRSRSLPTGASVRQSLYLDFLRCPNFSLWLHSRVAAAEEEQRRRYIASLLQGDVTTFGHTKGEIETIDLYGRLVEEIRSVDVQLTAPTAPGPGSRWRTDQIAVKKENESGRNTPTMGSTADAATTEKRLREQKKRLMEQLERLCMTLPDDLQSSLRRPK